MIPAVLLRRRLPVSVFDAERDCWVGGAADDTPVDADHLTVATFNVWNKAFFAGQRYRALAGLLAQDPCDVMVFQEVTDEVRSVLLSQPWVRERYRCAGVVGGRTGGYGMLLLSRLPIAGVTFSRLPSRRRRSFLQADLLIDGGPLRICSVHLESGKDGAWLRAWQLRRVFRAVSVDDAVVLGDFNMRDGEGRWISSAFRDVWPALRPRDPGYTEDSDINAMLRDSKKKARLVRFDRVLLKGDAWRATHIELLGTEPISLELPRVFPSDHFGVRCGLSAASHDEFTQM